MMRLILVFLALIALGGCGGRDFGNSAGSGTIKPCPPYCDGGKS